VEAVGGRSYLLTEEGLGQRRGRTGTRRGWDGLGPPRLGSLLKASRPILDFHPSACGALTSFSLQVR
jgi:hypothetical protein